MLAHRSTKKRGSMVSIRIGFGAALAVVLVLVVGVGTVGAHPSPIGSEVRIEDGGPSGASGVVISKAERCQRSRRVALFVKGRGGKAVKVDTTTTDAGGQWDIDTDLADGDYHAVAVKKLIKAHGKRHRCARAQSMTVHL
jgi:hypothetical protein